MLARGLACTVGALLALPATALADKVIEAQTVWRFDATSYTIDQGELLTFRNADQVSPGPHDVTSATNGPDGKPLFKSETIPAGRDTPVTGAQQLTTGSYSFFCSVHAFMEANLVVTDKGTPLPPAGGGPTPPPQADTRAPAVSASVRARSLRARSFLVTVTADEVAKLDVRLTTRLRGKALTIGRARVVDNSPGKAVAVRIRPTASARRALRSARRAAVTATIIATDAVGNSATTTTRRVLRR